MLHGVTVPQTVSYTTTMENAHVILKIPLLVRVTRACRNGGPYRKKESLSNSIRSYQHYCGVEPVSIPPDGRLWRT